LRALSAIRAARCSGGKPGLARRLIEGARVMNSGSCAGIDQGVDNPASPDGRAIHNFNKAAKYMSRSENNPAMGGR
jgi:hypothetical protein